MGQGFFFFFFFKRFAVSAFVERCCAFVHLPCVAPRPLWWGALLRSLSRPRPARRSPCRRRGRRRAPLPWSAARLAVRGMGIHGRR